MEATERLRFLQPDGSTGHAVVYFFVPLLQDSALDYYIGMFKNLDMLQRVGGNRYQVGEMAGGKRANVSRTVRSDRLPK